MSGGGDGAATPQAQSTSTYSQLPTWYNSIVQQLGGQIGNQVGGMNEINSQFLGGGTAPAGGVFNGGQTQAAPTPAQQPLPLPTLGPMGSMNPPNTNETGPGGFPLKSNGGSSGGNSMGTGIGSLSGNTGPALTNFTAGG